MKYTINNPKLIKDAWKYSSSIFTGVAKDRYNTIAYFEAGKFHRIDGPAIIFNNGDKEWFIHGKCHREDGPAVEFPDGRKSWYYNGECWGLHDDFTVESWIKFCKLQVFK